MSFTGGEIRRRQRRINEPQAGIQSEAELLINASIPQRQSRQVNCLITMAAFTLQVFVDQSVEHLSALSPVPGINDSAVEGEGEISRPFSDGWV